MEPKFKLRVDRVPVFTNLETRLNSCTTKEQAMKEAERLCDGRIPLEDYEWKIEGCAKGGILEFDDDLKKAIVEQIEEDPEESVDWNGMNAAYEMNLFHLQVLTNLEFPIGNQATKEEAIAEVQRLINENRLFESDGWKIEDCDEGGINDLNEDLQSAILEKLKAANLEDCVVASAG